MIVEAPLHDKDCVLGNVLAAHYLSSSDHHRAKSYLEAATSNLVSLSSTCDSSSSSTCGFGEFNSFLFSFFTGTIHTL